jgi:dienelactone hydrolase
VADLAAEGDPPPRPGSGSRARATASPRARAAARLRALLTGLCLAAAGSLALAQETVRFDSFDRSGPEPVSLLGHWFPAGAAPAPAAVLLHGCGGAYARDGRLGERLRQVVALLNRQGVHALVLDSLRPRGETELCTQRIGARRITQTERRLDAQAALAWLAARPDVVPGGLGLIGWSNGASTVLATLNEAVGVAARAPVKANFAVAYYPGCEADLRRGFHTGTPLLMLLGEADDWTPAAPCIEMARSQRGGVTPQVEVYPGAYHGFDGSPPVRLRRDVPNGVRPGEGVHVGGQPEAREASERALLAFLAVQRPGAAAGK